MNLREERDRDLIEAYDRKLKEIGHMAAYMSRKSLIKMTVESKAKRHYVSVDEAVRRIAKIENTGHCGLKSNSAISQYRDIYARYLEKKKKYPYMQKCALVQMVLDEPAERFYLDVESACVLFCKLNKK